MGSINYRKARISDAFGIAKVSVDSWKSTYKGIISEEYLQSLSYSDKEENWTQRIENPTHGAIIYVAEIDLHGIVGFILATLEKCNPNLIIPHPEKFKGELCAIYVLKNFQRKKIGSELIKLVKKYFKANNVNSMIVWVLKENSSRRFYETLGGKYLGEQSIEIAGNIYIEIAYGWENIEDFLFST
ncbi:MAG: GNAT family N-acetyltransferase [Promethearchaeota archaeon]